MRRKSIKFCVCSFKQINYRERQRRLFRMFAYKSKTPTIKRNESEGKLVVFKINSNFNWIFCTVTPIRRFSTVCVFDKYALHILDTKVILICSLVYVL